MKPLRLLVVRRWLSSNESLGKLFINGHFFCYTLEDEVRPRGEKVPGETAIPYGKYIVGMTYSPKFGRIMPEIQNVPMFSGIRIHSGNTDEDTAGCLLVGFSREGNRIARSREAFGKLFSILEEADHDGRRITIKFIPIEVRVMLIAGVILLLTIIAFLIYLAVTNAKQS